MFGRVLLTLSAALVCCLFTSTARAQAPYSNWYLAHSITNPTPKSGRPFGHTVAGVGSDKVLIGTHLYDLSGTLLTTYTDPTPLVSDFGWTVSAVGSDKVLIGAWGDNTGATDAGAAYLYDLSGTLLMTYYNPTPESEDWFGAAVSGVGNDKVLIGARWDDTGAMNAGSAYLYDLGGTLLTTYTNPTPDVDDQFGYTVAALGSDKVLIGAWRDNTGAMNAGSAYLYDLGGTLLTTYTNPTPASDDCFGYAVSAVGSGRVLIGAWGDNTGAPDAGAAYLYDLGGTLLATYTNPTPEIDDNFGGSLAAVGSGRVLIGAWGDNTGAPDAGAAYLYEVVPLLSIDPSPDPDVVRISWMPDTGTNWVLQSIPNLSATNWLNVPSGSTNPVDVPGSESNLFFRLTKP